MINKKILAKMSCTELVCNLTPPICTIDDIVDRLHDNLYDTLLLMCAEKDMYPIIETLKTNTSLKVLKIKNEQVFDTYFFDVLSESLNLNNTLTSLKLSSRYLR